MEELEYYNEDIDEKEKKIILNDFMIELNNLLLSYQVEISATTNDSVMLEFYDDAGDTVMTHDLGVTFIPSEGYEGIK